MVFQFVGLGLEAGSSTPPPRRARRLPERLAGGPGWWNPAGTVSTDNRRPRRQPAGDVQRLAGRRTQRPIGRPACRGTPYGAYQGEAARPTVSSGASTTIERRGAALPRMRGRVGRPSRSWGWPSPIATTRAAPVQWDASEMQATEGTRGSSRTRHQRIPTRVGDIIVWPALGTRHDAPSRWRRERIRVPARGRCADLGERPRRPSSTLQASCSSSVTWREVGGDLLWPTDAATCPRPGIPETLGDGKQSACSRK